MNVSLSRANSVELFSQIGKCVRWMATQTHVQTAFKINEHETPSIYQILFSFWTSFTYEVVD